MQHMLRCLLIFWLSSLVSNALGHEAIKVFWQAEIAAGRISPEVAASTNWQAVSLSDGWRRQKPCRSGDWTYKLDFAPSAPERAQGLYIHRAGNRLHVWLNGVSVARFGELDNPDADYSNAPLYVPLSPQHLHPGSNQLLIQVAGDCRRYAGLSQVEIGPHELLEPQWRSSNRLFVWQSVAIISISGTLALFSLGIAMWRRDLLSFLLGLSSAFWALRALLWSMNELPISYELWFFLIDFCYGIWMVLIALLALSIPNLGNRWLFGLQWVCLVLFLGTSITTALGGPAWLKALGIDITVVGGFVAISRVWVEAFRRPNSANIPIGIAGFFMLVLGLVDHWNVWFSTAPDAYQRFYFTPLIVLFFILSLGIVLARRYDRALRSEESYRHSLEAEVARQRAQLEAHYRESQELVRHEAATQERQRIVREMHDGLGAQLVDILSTVRDTEAGLPTVEREIQDALDQLRYTMDTLSSDCEDLSTVLAQFRFRNETRFLRAGIAWRWSVHPLPEAQWGPEALLHFERILREIFTNILKHAGASEVVVDAGCDAAQCHIHICDNGRGCDPLHIEPGRGLRHLNERARELGITLEFESAPQSGTCLKLHWPTSLRDSLRNRKS